MFSDFREMFSLFYFLLTSTDSCKKSLLQKKIFDDNDGKILTTSQNGQNVWKWWFGLHPI